MAHTTTMTVRLGETLGSYVAKQTSENGAYDNVSEYVRDLIRKDRERAERLSFERLKAELQLAFAASDETYVSLDASDIIRRNAE